MKIILASASQRRKELLKSIGVEFEVVVSNINEDLVHKKINDPGKLVIGLARLKALAVQKIIHKTRKEYLILAADTVVVLGNKIMGKPKNKKEAELMLKALRRRKHLVITGLALLDQRQQLKQGLTNTQVLFKDYSQKEIDTYLAKGFYLDRAAGYGIQDEGFNFVKNYQGSYTNILGLPLEKFKEMLGEYKSTKIQAPNNK